jgi:hypothetical protein
MYYRQTFCQQINIGQNDTLNEISGLQIQKFRKFRGVRRFISLGRIKNLPSIQFLIS